MNPIFTGPVVEPPVAPGGTVAMFDNLFSVILPVTAVIGLGVLLWRISTTARRGEAHRPRYGSLGGDAIWGGLVALLGAAWNIAWTNIDGARLVEIRDRPSNFVDLIPAPMLASIIAAPAVLSIVIGMIALSRRNPRESRRRVLSAQTGPGPAGGQ